MQTKGEVGAKVMKIFGLISVNELCILVRINCEKMELLIKLE